MVTVHKLLITNMNSHLRVTNLVQKLKALVNIDVGEKKSDMDPLFNFLLYSQTSGRTPKRYMTECFTTTVRGSSSFLMLTGVY